MDKDFDSSGKSNDDYPRTISSSQSFRSQNGSSLHLNDKRSEKIGNSLSEKYFKAGGQCSLEENSILNNTIVPPVNGHASLPCIYPNNHCENLVNNFTEDKCNLRCPEEKAFCLYHKFPHKVNNNVYLDKASLNDGMDDYFRQSGTSINNGSSNNKTYYEDNQSESNEINALNGEEDDEDNGCIYTYKGEDYEANLSRLMDTCFSCGLPTKRESEGQHGAVSIQRILNGSSPHPNSHQNLYSPEMDFLEMDFDPGSNGDGGESDCEDNSILNVDSKDTIESSLQSLETMNTPFEKKHSNLPTEMRNLLCRRCEMCMYNEQKVTNTVSFNHKTNHSIDNNLQHGINSILDDRPSSSKTNKHPDKQFCPDSKDFHIDLNCMSEDSSYKPNNNITTASNIFIDEDNHRGLHSLNDESNLKSSGANIENNLDVCDEDSIENFSDGDEADDEGGEESVSEQPNNFEIKSPSPTSVSPTEYSISDSSLTYLNKRVADLLKTNKQMSLASQKCTANILSENISSVRNIVSFEEKNIADISGCVNNEDNNLGSISAPEVSPSKEYSPLDKFSRSISFHNQLSSPKYENICLTHRYKNDSGLVISQNHIVGSSASNFCNCKVGNSSSMCDETESTNLEACADRLNQRERSIFNISSNSANSNNISLSNADSSPVESSPVEDNTPSSPLNITDSPSSSANSSRGDSLSLMKSGLRFKWTKEEEISEDPNTASPSLCGEISPENRLEKVMIWTERQASFKQVSQIGTSACGPTAIINVMLALAPVKSSKTVVCRLRAENALLVEYLLSRTKAGTTHDDLLNGIEEVSEGIVYGRFFHMFPKRAVQLSRWLSKWIKKGCVPVATLNRQVCIPPGQTMPDSWHHQMVFGVGPQGIYLTNPLECVADSLLSDQLCSDSVLLVRRADVTSRWDGKDRLSKLALQDDKRWMEMNVLGQVACILKEEECCTGERNPNRRHLTSHISIPASYQSGISLFIRKDNPSLDELKDAPELPLLDE